MRYISEDPTLALVTFFTILTWCGVIYIIYLMWDSRKTQKPNTLLGYVESITQTPEGIEITGKLNEDGVKVISSKSINTFSTGFGMTAVDSKFVDGVRVIEKANLHSVSLNVHPGPGGGYIESVDDKPVDYVGTQPQEGSR